MECIYGYKYEYENTFTYNRIILFLRAKTILNKDIIGIIVNMMWNTGSSFDINELQIIENFYKHIKLKGYLLGHVSLNKQFITNNFRVINKIIIPNEIIKFYNDREIKCDTYIDIPLGYYYISYGFYSRITDDIKMVTKDINNKRYMIKKINKGYHVGLIIDQFNIYNYPIKQSDYSQLVKKYTKFDLQQNEINAILEITNNDVTNLLTFTVTHSPTEL